MSLAGWQKTKCPDGSDSDQVGGSCEGHMTAVDAPGSETGACDVGPGADLAGCDLSGRDLTRADLSGADLTGAKLVGTKLSSADLTEAEMVGVDLTNANLWSAKLGKAVIIDSTAERAIFKKTDLTEAELDRSDLDGANLYGAIADKTSMVGTSGAGIRLAQPVDGVASFREADLRHSKFEGAVGAGLVTWFDTLCLDETESGENGGPALVTSPPADNRPSIPFGPMLRVLALALVLCALGAWASVPAAGAATPTTTFTAVEDTYVRSDQPSGTNGSSTSLRVDASPIFRSYMRFDLSALEGQVTRATLKLSTKKTTQEVDVRTTTGAWSEKTSYSTAPAPSTSVLAAIPATACCGEVSADVTDAVGGKGQLDLALTTGSSSESSFGTTEDTATGPPQLVIETTPTGPATVLFTDSFPSANGVNSLITNSYAFNQPEGVQSPHWETNSGSLFWQSGTGWSGRPSSSCTPDVDSIPCTNSGIFRLRTKRTDFGDVRVDTDLRVNAMTDLVSKTTSVGEGVQLWLRYQADRPGGPLGTDLYKFETNRRDGNVTIKKKCFDTGSSTNDGVYYELARSGGHPIPLGRWQKIGASAKNNTGGSVTLKLYREGVQLLEATDRGTGCAPLRGAGRVGVRGDDADFNLDNFRVTSLGGIAPADTTAPETAITDKPADPTSDRSASFRFTGNDNVDFPDQLRFQCRLDSQDELAWGGCDDPTAYTSLGPGSHTFEVRATDQAGNVDPTPASYGWTVSSQATCTAKTTLATASADGWVLQGSPTGKFGSDSALKVDSKAGDNARALLRFGLLAIPAGCRVTSARLRLYAASFKDGRTLEALRVGGSWTETGVTWSNQPAPTGTAAVAASASGYVEWSVTSQVQSMYSGSNHGFLLRDRVENGDGVEQVFNSREKGTDRPPELVLGFGG